MSAATQPPGSVHSQALRGLCSLECTFPTPCADLASAAHSEGPTRLPVSDAERIKELRFYWESLTLDLWSRPATRPETFNNQQRRDVRLELEDLADRYGLPQSSAVSDAQWVQDMLALLFNVTRASQCS